MNTLTQASAEQSADRATPAPRRGSARQVMNAVAHAFGCGAFSPGDIADLRRMEADDPSCPAFWKAMTTLVAAHVDLPDGGAALDRAECKWACILNAAVHLDGLHQPGKPLGAALAEAGYSELRFSRLLRARDNALFDVVRTTARYLAAKGVACDLADIADLVLSDGQDHSEQVRRRIARTYFQSTSNT